MELAANDVIVDWHAACEAAFCWQAPHLSEILTLFQLSECVVLADRLLLYDRERHVFEDCPLANLVEKGIVVFVPEGQFAPGIEQKTLEIPYEGVSNALRSLLNVERRRALGVNPALFDSQSIRESFSRYIAADRMRLDHVAHPVVSSLHTTIYATQRTSLSLSLYQELAQSIGVEVMELISMGAALELNIPPIPAVVLNRAGRKLKAYVPKLIELREEFEGFREKYRSYQRVLENPDDLSLAELLRAKEEAYDNVVRQISELEGTARYGRSVKELYEALVSGQLVESEGDVELKISSPITKLLQSALRKMRVRRIKGRAKKLFDLWQSVLQIKNYNRLVTQTFDIDPDELKRQVRAYAEFATAWQGVVAEMSHHYRRGGYSGK